MPGRIFDHSVLRSFDTFEQGLKAGGGGVRWSEGIQGRVQPLPIVEHLSISEQVMVETAD